MKLSIILITYNQEKYLEKSIESILNQHFLSEAEIIVADDYSTDKSFSIIQEKLRGCKWPVHYLPNNQNIGISANYHRAIQACSGEYIAVMEGDDYWTDPGRLEKHVTFLDNHFECVMSMNRFVWFHEKQKKYIVEPWNHPEPHYYVNTHDMAAGNKLGNLSACVFRASVLKSLEAEVFNMEIADWMLGMAVSREGLIAVLQDVMSVYRIHGNGQWAGLDKEKQIKKALEIIDQYNHFFDGQYAKEFSKCKAQLLSQDRPKRSLDLKQFLPPIIIGLLRWIIPPAFINFIRR
jgi:glycosyltransferase involved in cell wall biosynthesis